MWGATQLAANFAELRRELDLHRLDIMSYRDAKLQSQREIKRTRISVHQMHMC
jgi:hypothetical protein